MTYLRYLSCVTLLDKDFSLLVSCFLIKLANVGYATLELVVKEAL